jgi:protease I
MARVAFIVEDMFEDSEFQVPYDAVQEAGHEAVIISSSSGKELTGKKGAKITSEKSTADISAEEFDALVIPGGYSPDKVRMDENAVALTHAFHDDGKPVAAICHAPWVLAEADLLRGTTVTSWPSLRTDLENAGARWVDQELVRDGNIITSRKPDDLPAFCSALLSDLP